MPGVAVERVFHYVRDDSRARRARCVARGLGKLVNGVRFLAALPRLMRLARRADIVHSQGWEIPQIGLLGRALPAADRHAGRADRARHLRARRARSCARAASCGG